VAVLFVPPFAIGRVPETSVPKATAPHDGLPDAFPCKTVVVVPWLANKAEASVGLKYVGAADDPVLLPKIVSAAALEIVNDRAGVVVAVATEVVNNGLKAPAEKVVTVPVVGVVQVYPLVVPFTAKTCPAVPIPICPKAEVDVA
jgi:hypothetical protein